MSDNWQQETREYDISIIRPRMKSEDVELRGLDMSIITHFRFLNYLMVVAFNCITIIRHIHRFVKRSCS